MAKEKKKKRKHPNRARQHVIDDLAVHDIEGRVLAAGWIPRDQDHDYGIDFEIEIVHDGDVTGQIFKAQVKGTEDKNLERALGVRLSSQKLTLFRAMKLPVLIVRHHVPTGRTFVRFVHSHAPDASWSKDSPKTIRMSEDDEWTTDTPARLEAQVTAFHELWGSRLGQPLVLKMDGAPDVGGTLAAEIELALRELVGPAQADDVVVGPAEGIVASVRLNADRITVDLSSVVSSSTSYENPSEPSARQLAADVLVLTGITLARLGHSEQAVRVMQPAALDSLILPDLEIATRVFGAFVHARRIPEALELEAQMSKDGEWPEGLFAFSLLDNMDSFSETDRAKVEAHYRAMVQEAEVEGDERAMAATHLNLGVALRSLGRGGEALEELERAIELHPDHVEESRVQLMLGGSKFLSGDMPGAVEAYGRAVELGEAGSVHALFADALMHSGEYAAALSQLEEHFSTLQGDVDPEWILKATVLEAICQWVDSQERNVEAAETLAEQAEKLGGKERDTALNGALDADMLCAHAWYGLGVAEAERGQHERAFLPFLAAAVLDPHHCGTWVPALMSGALARVPGELLAIAIVFAYRHCEGHLIDHVREQLDDQPELRDLTINAIAEVTRLGDTREPSDTVILGLDN